MRRKALFEKLNKTNPTKKMPENVKQYICHMEDFLKSPSNVDTLRAKIKQMNRRDSIIKSMQEDD